jgi:hypothetical protein
LPIAFRLSTADCFSIVNRLKLAFVTGCQLLNKPIYDMDHIVYLDKKAKEETRSRSGYIQLILKQYLQKRNEKNEKN